jgi:hypothetical protein
MIPSKWMYRILGGVLVVSTGALAWSAWGNPERQLLAGDFHSVAHKGTGEVRVVQLADGRRVLRLAGVKTYPGQDLQVCLVAAPDAEDNETVRQAGAVCVGKFGAGVVSSTYELPAAVNLARYRAVTIWSREYGVNFTTAPLQ